MQTEIAEILNDIREENKRNVENFEKAFAGLNTKLEVISEDNEAVELVRFYIAELKKVLEDRLSASVIKFDALEATVDHLASVQLDLAKTSELKDLFKVFGSQNEVFMNEISNQKDVLDSLALEISKIDEKSLDKQELTGMIQDISEKFSNLDKNILNSVSVFEKNLETFNISEQVEKLCNNIGELKSLITPVPDYSGEFEKLEKNLENVVSEADFSGFRADLAEFVQKIIDNSSILNTELKFSSENILKVINSFNFSDLSNDLNTVKENLNDLKNVTYQASFDELSNTLVKISDGINDLRFVAVGDVQDNYSAVKMSIDELNSNLQSVKEEMSKVSNEIEAVSNNNSDFLKGSLVEITSNINSLIDSFNIFKTDVVINRDKLYEIADALKKMEPIDYSYDIQEISSKILDLIGENTSHNDFIAEKFDSIRELIETFDNSEAVKSQIEGFEKAFLKVVTTEDFLNFKTEFAEFLQKVIDNSNALYDSSNVFKDKTFEEFESLNSALSDLAVNVQYLRDISSQKSSEMLDNISSYVNCAVEKLNSDSEINFGELKKSFEKVFDEFIEVKNNIVQKNDTNVFKVSEGFDNLKLSLENILSVLNSMGATNESISAIDEKITRLNEVITGLSVDIASKQDEFTEHVNDTNEKQASDIKNILENITVLRDCIYESVECLKNYIKEVEDTSNSLISEGDDNLSHKFLDLETALVQSSNEYEQKMELLQVKITEFARIIENSNSETESKLTLAIDELQALKDEMSGLNDAIKSAKLINDEKFSETASLLDAGIENIILNITNISDSVTNGVEASFRKNLSNIDENFCKLLGVMNEIKSQHTLNNVDLIQDIEEKVTSLKDELELINSDIVSALECKSEEIIRAFDPVKTNIEEFIGFDFEKVLADLKSQLELLFMNFSVDINSEFVQNSEAISKLEQVFKETFNKLSDIEECVNEKFQNNIELLNVNLNSVIKEMEQNIEDRIDSQTLDFKDYIDSLSKNEQIEISIGGLKQISENNFDEVNSKLDIIMSGTSVENLQKHFDKVFENNDKFLNNFDNLSKTEEQISDMMSVLHEKVDALVADSSDFDILEELDGIKDIIFEQRKFFEVSSDERASAIDKYLRDVLLKLDSVDLEKNADDIKESILNALVSLVDQISFVEETEEIKDFVEEKTYEINQNLIEVRNQLKQLTSPGDDFDYSYSLQDVESDIAKLRLAITNMSGNDFSEISDEIKKIVDAVENLENSLTQEQIVGLKSDIEKLNEDIVSISSRTNKLLLNSDESYKALSDGLNNFSNIIYRLEERINDNERIEQKLDNIHSMAVEAGNADKVFHQVMMYLGEWIDTAGENINSIYEKTSEIDSIKESIKELREVIPEKQVILSDLEQKFERQEERIDRLEMALDRVILLLEQKDDKVLERKVDKIEKLLSALDKNVEKLTSYVDEE